MSEARDPAAASVLGPRLPSAIVALGLVPSLLIAWLLWLAPVGDLAADRSALAMRDFTALWAAGRAVAEHAADTLSDPARFNAWLRTLFGDGMPTQIWPYPPFILLLARPLAGLPLLPSYVLYNALALAALALPLRAVGLSRPMIAAILLSPAVTTNALAGQNGTLVAALLGGGLLLLDRRPALAGLLLGALCIKPQFGLLMPLVLLASRRMEALIFGCISAATLALSSILWLGYEPWVEFFAHSRGTVTDYVGVSWQAHPAQTLFSSVFMAARSMGASTSVAYSLQGLVTVGCAVAVWRLWSDRGPPPHQRVAATIALVMLAAPWVHTYDWPVLALAVVLLLRSATSWRRWLLAFAWLWPGWSALVVASPLVSVGMVAGVAGTALRGDRSRSA